MKKLLAILITSLIIASCTSNRKEVFILRTLDQFETQEENEQLGIDLISYRYYEIMQQEFPDFTEEVYNGISWQYFIQDNNKEVSFRLTLSNDALKHKDKITKFFEKTIDKQIEHQVNQKDFFEDAKNMTLKYFELLDENNFDRFWENTSENLRQKITKDEFFESMKDRENCSKIGGQRVFSYKQYYETMPGVDLTNIYVICFTFEKDKNMLEQLTYHKDGNKLKIIGYHFRNPN